MRPNATAVIRCVVFAHSHRPRVQPERRLTERAGDRRTAQRTDAFRRTFPRKEHSPQSSILRSHSSITRPYEDKAKLKGYMEFESVVSHPGIRRFLSNLKRVERKNGTSPRASVPTDFALNCQILAIRISAVPPPSEPRRSRFTAWLMSGGSALRGRLLAYS